MTVSYTPGFTHTDWVDNQDRVQAGGGNGFNVRFHAIEAEFATLQLVVQSINDALTGLSTKPPPRTLTAAFTPNLVSGAADQWQHGEGFATVPNTQVNADGMMDIQLPQGSTVNTLRVIGSKNLGTVLVVDFRRQPIAHGSAPQTVAIVAVPQTQTGTFDLSVAPSDPALALVDAQRFRYYVVARLEQAVATASGGAELDSFLFTYTE